MDEHNKISLINKEIDSSRRRFFRNTFGLGVGMILMSLFSQTKDGRATSCCYGNCYVARGRR